MQIIDPPVGPFSDPEDIRRWIKKLEAMSPSPERDYELESAKSWLKYESDRKSGKTP